MCYGLYGPIIYNLCIYYNIENHKTHFHNLFPFILFANDTSSGLKSIFNLSKQNYLRSKEIQCNPNFLKVPLTPLVERARACQLLGPHFLPAC